MVSDWGPYIFGLPPVINYFFEAALGWIAPRDPLVLDLDGDGIEATSIDTTAPTLFDHDADGIKTATGWIKSDDGTVVLDLNSNGTIDSGRELFGDNTLLPDGNTAANGFAAIAQHDANQDGKIDVSDAAFAQLRIWQDANQDGISQGGELKTLAELGIASINVTGQASTITLGNGNSQPWSGSFTRANGTAGDSGTPELSGSLLRGVPSGSRKIAVSAQLLLGGQANPLSSVAPLQLGLIRWLHWTGNGEVASTSDQPPSLRPVVARPLETGGRRSGLAAR